MHIVREIRTIHSDRIEIDVPEAKSSLSPFHVTFPSLKRMKV